MLSAESRARAIARREAIGGAAGNFVVNAAINVWMLSGKGPHVMSVDSIASTERTLLSAAVPLAVSLSIVVATLTFFQFRKKAAGLDPSIDARLARPYYPIGLANAIGAALTSFGAVVTAAVLWQRAFGSVEVSTLVAALIAGTVAAISALYASLRTTTALLRS